MAHLIPAFFTKVAICMLVFAIVSGCVTEAPAAGDEVLVRKFFELREQMLDQRGTPAQVEQILSLFKDGGQYEHPAFSVILTLDEAKSGMIAHLKEGRDAKITVNRIFHGSNFAVAETTLRYFIPDESGHLKKLSATVLRYSNWKLLESSASPNTKSVARQFKLTRDD